MSDWVSEWVTRSPIELFWTAKNGTFRDCRLISVLEVKFCFFHMCFGMLSPFHSATQITSIQNHNCSKNAKTLHLVTLSLNSQIIIGFSELTSNENGRRWIWMCNAFHIHGRELHIYGKALRIHGKAFKKTCQRMHILHF